MSFLNNEVRKRTTIIESTEEKLRVENEVFAGLDFVVEMREDFEILESLHTKTKRVEELEETLKTEVKNCVTLYKKISYNTALKKELEKLVAIGAEYKTITKKEDDLLDIINHIEVSGKSIKVTRIPDLSSIEDVVNLIEKINFNIKTLHNIIKLIQLRSVECGQLREELDRKQQKFKEQLDGRCPLCGSELDVDNCNTLC